MTDSPSTTRPGNCLGRTCRKKTLLAATTAADGARIGDGFDAVLAWGSMVP